MSFWKEVCISSAPSGLLRNCNKKCRFSVYPRANSWLSLKRQENLSVKVNNSVISLSYSHQHFVPLSSLGLFNAYLIVLCRLNPRTGSIFLCSLESGNFLRFEMIKDGKLQASEDKACLRGKFLRTQFPYYIWLKEQTHSNCQMLLVWLEPAIKIHYKS